MQGGHALSLLRGGDELFPVMCASFAQAQRSIWLATYIFHDDQAGQQLAEGLAGAARRGVRVRVLVDGFGSRTSLARVRAWLEPAGVELLVFRPLERWWHWFQPGQLRRLHLKLCSVDEQVAYVGGINLMDDRLDLSHGLTDQPRLDFAVRLQGPAARGVAQTVAAIWRRTRMFKAWRLAWAEIRAAQVLPLRMAWHRWMVPRMPTTEPGDVNPVRLLILVRDNFRRRRTIERSLREALDGAVHRFDLVTPYFYPGLRIRQALMAAAKRGVRVRLLLQGKLDYRLAGWAAQVMYDQLLAAGVMIHEYTPAFLHAKLALADSRWATVGSSNIDPLSLLLNLEANVVVDDADFNAVLSAQVERALAQSRQVLLSTSPQGFAGWLRRVVVAWMAHTYLRMAGMNGRY